MVFAVKYDDFKRKLAAKPVAEFPFKAELLSSCTYNTAEWHEWFTKANLPDSDIHVSVEDDHKTYVFYKIVPREE